MKKSFNPSVSLLIIALLIIQSVLSLRTPAQTARLSDEITFHAIGDGPWLNLSGERESLTSYTGYEQASSFAPMATFTVTNTNDSGAGSLRQAILDANNNPGPDMITFNIDSGPVAPASDHRPAPHIAVRESFPEIIDPLILDGTTQAPFSTAVIELDGSNAGSGANGLTITAGNSVVKGLAIGNFNGHAISLQQRGNNMIMNNFLGTDATCTENRGNGGEGVNILNSNNNTVMSNTIVFNGDGGSVINSDGNVIRDNNLGTDATMTSNKGNLGAGFGFANASNTRFEFNRVAFNRLGFFGFSGTGTILQGNKVMDNTEDGFFASNSSGMTIGGEARGAFNIFSHNGRHGVNLFNTVGTVIKANFFGTDPQGANLGNGIAGVNLDGTTSMTQIGGPVPEARNTFAFNQFGIAAGPITRERLWIFNTYDQNASLAVEIGRNGPDSNDFRDQDRLSGGSLNSPELNSAAVSGSETIIQGRLHSTPNRQFTIQYYWGPRLNLSGRGDGAPLGALQVTTDANGDASASARFSAPLTTGFVSAVTTDLTTGDASEFGNGVAVTGGGVPDLEIKKSGPETAKCREMVTYTITVRNVGTAAAIGARVSDTLPGCVEDEVEVIKPEGTSFSEFPNGVTTILPRLDPGAPPVTITIKATLREDCNERIVNIVSGSTDGDTNFSNNSDQVFTMVDCAKITGITVQGKHVTVSGVGFVKGDEIEINGVFVKKTKFIDIDELFAKKGKKLLMSCDPANPERMNIIRLRRSSDPGAPIIDTEAFATCP